VKKNIRKMSYNKRVTSKIRSVCGPLIIGRRDWAELAVNWAGFETFLGFCFLEEELQRRGVHVKPPKIGSRGGVFVHRRNLRFHAVLRREFSWGVLFSVIFGILGGGPRGCVEEGGQFVCFGGLLC
jgi:hypothetical protein